jgi:hypothetical protein
MKPADRARQIDQEEFRRESEQALQRALAYSKRKQDERRRQFLITVHGEAGKTMPLVAEEKRQSRQPVVLYGVNGLTMTRKAWADQLGVSEACLYVRAKKLGSMEAAIAMGGINRRKRSTNA